MILINGYSMSAIFKKKSIQNIITYRKTLRSSCTFKPLQLANVFIRQEILI